MVSDALPGVTPDTKVTRFVGNCCACAPTENARTNSASVNLISSSYCFGNPNCAASQSAVRLR